MIQAAANYIDAHEYTTNTHHDAVGKKGQVVSNKRSNDGVDVNHEKAIFGQCSHCGMKTTTQKTVGVGHSQKNASNK